MTRLQKLLMVVMIAAGLIVLGMVLAMISHSATLDDFNRLNGPVGGKWTSQAFIALENDKLKALSYTSTVYDSILPKDQVVSGVWAVVGGSEQDLLLKAQGVPGAHIEVRYDAGAQLMRVAAYNVAWVDYVQWPCTLAGGDTVTASCDSVGLVKVWKNSALVGTVSVTSWPYYRNGGRVGVTLGTAARLDVIAAQGFSPPPSPLNDPAHNVWLKWHWPTVDELGFPETSLAGARIYFKPDTLGATWSGTVVTTGAGWLDAGKPAFIAMPWSWFGYQPTRFMVAAFDTMYNEAKPSNEVVKSPP